MGEHRVSNSQLEEFLDYLISHPNLARGVGLGARSKETIEKEWNDLAKKLNAHGSGASKNGQRWKRYWIDLKHKVKTRAAARRREASGTGGGPAVETAVSETDKQILQIIGEGAVYGDTQHRIPVFPDHESASCSKGNIVEKNSELLPINFSENDNEDYDQHQPEVIQIYTIDEENTEELLPVHDTTEENINQATKKRKSQQTYQTLSSKKSKIEPNWVIELERKRVEAEEKMSNAAMIMAEASRTLAEAALIQANAAKMHAEAARFQAEAMNKQTHCLHNVLEELKKKI